MFTDFSDMRQVAVPGTMTSRSPPKLMKPLSCPRCDSTNTITTTSLNLATSASHTAVTGLKAELFVTCHLVVRPTRLPSTHDVLWVFSFRCVFNFTTGQHNVTEVMEYGYDNCSIANAISTLTTGQARITLNKTGYCYFICGFPNHCSASQKLKFEV
ncbi:hypothetical protein CXB51_014529 [Gossypium anomalum]|uniref:Phytocyanin domain-containing protein n=1 Tax=Gossypium anomalum TaxID=47600 RepID=A0A8J6D1D2_9ROSI|nr:hypothetical protein CXB51_014529 [Gossypium anomalum]